MECYMMTFAKCQDMISADDIDLLGERKGGEGGGGVFMRTICDGWKWLKTGETNKCDDG